MPAGTDPAVRPEPPGDNRWQRQSVVDALYLVDGEAGALGRVVPPSGRGRHAAMPPAVSLPRDLWSYDVASLEVADLSSADRLARVGLGLPVPGRRGWPRYQAVGEQLHREGWRGVVTRREEMAILLAEMQAENGPATPEEDAWARQVLGL